VLRRDPGSSPSQEVVAFTFQRFADTFITEALLRDLTSADDLVQSLKPGGALNYLLDKADGRFAGLLEALAVRAPEHFGVELVDAADGASEELGLSAMQFMDGLRWRSPDKITVRSVELLDEYRRAGEIGDAEFLDLLFRSATVPGHRLNADYLHDYLDAMALGERDAFLTAYLADADDESPVEAILDWARNAHSQTVDVDRTRLACIAVGWLTFSSNRSLRDRASTALTAILRRSPSHMAGLVARFADVDDAYVRERVFASILGAASFRTDAEQALEDAAVETWKAVFDKPLVERHVFVRHYARSVIELASSIGRRDAAIDLARVRPPYRSAPVADWPTESDVVPVVDSARSIVGSTLGYYSRETKAFTMPGDFGRYIMSSVKSFCAEERGERSPRTRGELSETFWEELAAQGGEVARLAAAALETAEQASRGGRRNWAALLKGDADTALADPELEATRARAQAADEALRARLGPEVKIPYPGHSADAYPHFSEGVARAWVALRAIALGWTEALHEELENRTGYWGGRDKHTIERLGKKYQWIAWRELLGILQDHYWYEGADKTLEVLDDILEVEELDIDLSFIGADPAVRPDGLPALALPASNLSTPLSVDDAILWARSATDVPHPPALVEGVAADGTRWWAVRAYRRDDGYMDKLQSAGPMRTGQAALQLVIVKADEIDALYARQSSGKVNSVDMGAQGYFHDRFLGQYRPGLNGQDEDLESWIDGIRFGRISRRFKPHRGGYDHGELQDHPAFEIPRDWVIEALSLRPADADAPWFVTPDGQTALFDPESVGDPDKATVINADLLEPLLQERGYVAAWSLWAEKDGGQGSGPGWGQRGEGPFERMTYCGLWWCEGGQWKGSLWSADEQPSEVDTVAS
jgi:hypothetical protein